MRVSIVETPAERKEFLEFPRRLYKGDPFWVCPLDKMTENVFNREKNYMFRRGDAIRWILKDDTGNTAGRVAAFIDEARSSANRQPTGGIGFFEVIDDRDAAFALFDAGREWLAARGMDAMDGPVNFGENDNYWGLLVDGFMRQGYGMPYNKQYYRSFFEEYGFRNYFEQYSYHRTIRGADGRLEEFPGRIMKIAEWLTRRPGYTFRHFTAGEKDKFAADLVDIYNSAWSVFKEDFIPLAPEFIEDTFRKLKAIIDEELVWFAYHNEKPIAFFILLPDLNQIIRYFNGRLHPWNQLRFLWFRSRHKMTRIRAVVGGVNPQYQNNGVESAIFYNVYQVFRRKPWYNELELSWVGDFNPKMTAIYEALGAVRAKTHITYRFMISERIPFIRYKDEMAERENSVAGISEA